MKIDGRALARDILDSLKSEVGELLNQGTTPTLAVILVGDDPASISYIKQKQIAAEAIGAKIVMSQQLSTISNHQFKEIIEKYNNDPSIHGIIIQRPLPPETHIHTSALHSTVVSKDVDGFVPGSPFAAPVALAVTKIIERIFTYEGEKQDGFRIESGMTGFTAWLQEKTIVVVGRGETAGKPIFDHLRTLASERRGLSEANSLKQVHSQTNEPNTILSEADIIISCVGKQGIVHKEDVKPGAILIGVGIGRGDETKLQGDYNEAEIKDIAAYYTPTPGGVGPVNVACLMANLVTATRAMQIY